LLLVASAAGIAACAASDEPLRGSLVDTEAVAAAERVEPAGKVTSAGQPDKAALEVFAGSGYRAVIDLRGADEDRGYDERDAVESLGMNYVSFPITGTGDIDFDKAAQLDALIESQEGPVLVHCGSGNRVGAMLALIDSLEGASDKAALATGREFGLTGLEDTVRERLEADDP
jgi:uncharacterized protein (TIGR01244 family)